MATLYKTSGESCDLGPATALTLEQMQKAVNGFIQVVYLKNGDQLVVNEEGKLDNLPFNLRATTMFDCNDRIVGDAIHFTAEEVDEIQRRDAQEGG